MSYLNTRQALVTHLLANLPAGLTKDDVAFENHKFEPANKPLWLACYFIPASSESSGKDIGDNDIERGIFQISVFVTLNGNRFDTTQLIAIDEILRAFKPTTELVYTTQTVNVLDRSVNTGSESEAYYQRDISINYLTISKR